MGAQDPKEQNNFLYKRTMLEASQYYFKLSYQTSFSNRNHVPQAQKQTHKSIGENKRMQTHTSTTI